MGAVKGLILTSADAVHHRPRQASWVLSFHPLKNLRVKGIIVSPRGLQFANFPHLNPPEDLTLRRLILHIEERSLRSARRSATFLHIPSVEHVLWIARMENLFFNTFCALLWLIMSDRYTLPDPETSVVAGSEKLYLWELLFMPVLSPVFVKEAEELINYSFKPRKEPKECVFSALNYIVGSRFFSFSLDRWVSFLLELHVLKPNHPETHCGLPAHTRKLPKPYERI